MNIASYIDHTILKQTTTQADIIKLCQEAIQYQFASVCIPPCFIPNAKKYLQQSTLPVATVVGFPWGYNTIATKAYEMEQAIALGATEIDAVVNIAAIKSGNMAYIEEEIGALANISHKQNIVLKIIIESGILTNHEIICCCEIVNEYPIHFLKTSTGFAEKGATIEAVTLFKTHLHKHIKIKASGGIKTKEDALQYINMGVQRLGSSSGVAIVNS
jgi:deoxyribose-phosphate aldolase